MSKKVNIRRKKRIVGNQERPRLVIFRSLNNIYAQIVDDFEKKTLVGLSSNSKALEAKVKKAKTRTDISKIVGAEIAKLAKKQKISKVVFDRNGYKYHGRVKALAESAREAGLEF